MHAIALLVLVVGNVLVYLAGWSQGHRRAMRAWRDCEARIRRAAPAVDLDELCRSLLERS